MPFDPNALVTLAATEGFTLWHYATSDTRAQTLASGYFAPSLARLRPGHVILVVASDALSMLPVRSLAMTGNGLVLDASNAPIRLTRSAVPIYAFSLAGSAGVLGLALSPLPTGLTVGRIIAVSASVGGPIGTVHFSIRDASDTLVVGPVTATPSGGMATATISLPAPGSGYRLRADTPDEPDMIAVSAPFSVTAAYSLLLQGSGRLLLEQGGALLLEP
ncbi:hypothetical protein ACQW02_26505 [Humitalea sp. 24SJ18S-53]|uniref:hypothetical protein n=1 Tax=Humitalea sp. 24SJ18S-53 TaxID=3422307 RepID=UPI003D67C69A